MSRRTVAVSGLSVAGSLAPGLPVLRALSTEPAFAKEWRAIGLSYDPLDPPNYDATLLSKSYLVPYPLQGAEALFARLRDIHAREKLDVVVPMLDPELPHYIRLAPRLRELGIRLLLPSAAAFKLRSKVELPNLAARTGVRVPWSLVAYGPDEAIRQAARLPFPLVVKGNTHGATIVQSLTEVGHAVAVHACGSGYPVLLQEFVSGTEFDVAALGSAQGELIGAVPMKKLQLDDRGKAWGALTIEDPAIYQLTSRVMRGLRWIGAMELELVRHQSTGELYLIEINPRFPAWIHLAAAAGQNLPWALLQLAMGEAIPRFQGYFVGVLQLRQAFDVTCSLGGYESLVSHGEVDLEKSDPALIKPRWVALPKEEAPSFEAHSEVVPGPAPPLTEELQPFAPSPFSGPGQSEGSAYERPAIVQHHALASYRMGAGHRFLSELEGVSIDSLVAQYGSPLFVFSERRLRAQARTLRRSFLTHYPTVRFAWSYKTNYLDAVCGILHQEGWDAEVVSELEYEMARRLGISGPRILCNGAHKPHAWLKRAMQEGALVQIDHFDELEALEALTREHPNPLPVGLRVNMRLDGIGHATWERFGFNLDNGEVLDAILRVAASRSLKLFCLHCHLGTCITDPEVYRQAAARLASLHKLAESMCRHPVHFINLGGGFPSSNILGTAYDDGETDGPDIEPFAEAIGRELWSAFAPTSVLPTLILETGRYLVDDAGSLVATVVGTRRLASGERGVVLDAGLNVLYTAHWYRHRVVPAQPVAGPVEETTLHGPLCMSIDTLRATVPLPPLAPGHKVVIQPAGAYNVTQWMQFSQARPAVVMIAQDGTVELIRRSENISDVKDAERLPAQFAPGAGRTQAMQDYHR